MRGLVIFLPPGFVNRVLGLTRGAGLVVEWWTGTHLLGWSGSFLQASRAWVRLNPWLGWLAPGLGGGIVRPGAHAGPVRGMGRMGTMGGMDIGIHFQLPTSVFQLPLSEGRLDTARGGVECFPTLPGPGWPAMPMRRGPKPR